MSERRGVIRTYERGNQKGLATRKSGHLMANVCLKSTANKLRIATDRNERKMLENQECDL